MSQNLEEEEMAKQGCRRAFWQQEQHLQRPCDQRDCGLGNNL